MPEQLGHIPLLSKLYVSNNNIHGTLPWQLGSCTTCYLTTKSDLAASETRHGLDLFFGNRRLKQVTAALNFNSVPELNVKDKVVAALATNVYVCEPFSVGHFKASISLVFE